MNAALPDPYEVRPFAGPLDATVRPPGSKSLTNRALVCAALAEGTSGLHGVLFADDTEAMLDCLGGLGATLRTDRSAGTVSVSGIGGRVRTGGALLDARMSGTTARFVMPMAAVGHATVVLDGAEPLRRRPMVDLVDALVALGAAVEPLGEDGHLPVRIEGQGLRGGTIQVRGDVSSQFLSGLLLGGPCTRDGLTVEVSTPLVSEPYVEMTLAVMDAFGASISRDGRRYHTEPGGYTACDRYVVEPDASAASYFFAAAAILGGRVEVQGLGTASLQGDMGFVDVLEQMGATVTRWTDRTVVERTGPLRGIEVDLRELSDTAQTLAVVATFAQGPTTIEGIGFIRHKETDRIGAVVSELRRCGIDADEMPDGLRVHPGPAFPADVRTYDDHRMAMSFSLLGLVHDGVRIVDPGCVSKTFPGYWTALEALRA